MIRGAPLAIPWCPMFTTFLPTSAPEGHQRASLGEGVRNQSCLGTRGAPSMGRSPPGLQVGGAPCYIGNAHTQACQYPFSPFPPCTHTPLHHGPGTVGDPVKRTKLSSMREVNPKACHLEKENDLGRSYSGDHRALALLLTQL